MAATTTTHVPPPQTIRHSPHPTSPWLLLLPLLTALTFLIDGYHPLTEDGGVYVAGIERLLNPRLFPHDTAFVTAHLRYSVFAPMMAALVHLTSRPLRWVLLASYLFSLWLLLYAGLQIARRCTASSSAQAIAVALLGAWSTLPIAGTSLMLTDPYVTARSFTTPLTLLAIAFALDTWRSTHRIVSRSAVACVLCLLITALLHPLMAVSALALVVLLRLLRLRHSTRWCALLLVLSVLAVALVYHHTQPDPAPVVAASLSRYYWFLSQWQWFELCGLLGPVAILAWLQTAQPNAAVRNLCRACLLAGATAILLALLFAHAHSDRYLIARLQPLRVFLPIYAIMALLLAVTIPPRLSPTFKSLPLAAIAISGIALFFAQRQIYPASQHLELPWQAPSNAWSQAFIWVRNHTPEDALFALDPDYVTTDGEDAQTFRATAQRSVLPDFSKDGGEASITPSLTTLWQQSLAAQGAVQSGTHLVAHHTLSKQSDAERETHLRPLGVTWLLLLSDATTTHHCPYNNGTVKVCRLGN